MTSIWRLNEDRVEFERVTSAVLDAAVGERFTVAGIEFDTAEIECLHFADCV